MRVKFKKHWWYSHILKCKDPVILSIGWRTFQTIPVFVTDDVGNRKRMLKYTPKFGYCYALCYGPVYPVGTSFIGIRDLDDKTSNFRIAANGIVIELDQSYLV